ncbi:MAG: glycosyltransferase [Bryobacteraceae bacterium]|nr:glycosyltransferase [Bryobacteraceae bacterium]
MPFRLLGSLKETIRPYYLRWVYFPLWPEARPRYFQDCWNYPNWDLTLSAVQRELEFGRKPAFIFLPLSDWHFRRQRTQHFASALARSGASSFLLNPHLGRQFSGLRKGAGSARFSRLEPGVAELHPRLPREPVYHHRLLATAETTDLARQLNPLAEHLGGAALQIVSLPVWTPLARVLRSRFGWPIVYDCHDALRGFPNMASEVAGFEPEAMRDADAVLFSARSLWEQGVRQGSGIAAKSHLLPNAVDAEAFSLAWAARESRRGGSGPRKVIGYVGALESWFDTDVIRAAALRYPRWTFRLIGRVENPGVDALRALPNIELTGEVAYEDLPRQMAEFDVGLIPFRVNELTRATNPIKLYEYFACGLPVVSSALPEVLQYGDLVYGGGDFGEQLGEAAAEADRERERRRIEIARRESWDERAAILRNLAAELLDCSKNEMARPRPPVQ